MKITLFILIFFSILFVLFFVEWHCVYIIRISFKIPNLIHFV